jgi:hypothetical protein
MFVLDKLLETLNEHIPSRKCTDYAAKEFTTSLAAKYFHLQIDLMISS